MSATGRRRLLAAALLAVTLSGCGVAAQEQPVRVDPDDVPFGLLEESRSDVATSTTSTTLARGPER